MKMQNLAIPTNEQRVWHDLEVGMFIHWAPYVYVAEGEKNLTPPLEAIDGVDFDVKQWVQTAIDLNAKYIVFVAKHAGGFCLWQTDTTPYSVKHIAWKQGKGDVLAELSAECRRRGLRLGVYLSPMDAYLGVKVGGKCETPEKQAEYDQIYRTQLREVLDNYGDIFEIWFDGGNVCPIEDILREHPGVIIFNSRYANIRWVGNEMGTARYPAWNGVPAALQTEHPLRDAGTPDGEAWMPLECDTTIRRGWFWTPGNADTLKSLEKLLRTYYVTVGHGAVLLLNSNPDRRGRIPEADAARAKELGDLIRRLEAGKLADTTGAGDELTLTLSRPSRVDHLMLAEDIRFGERVRAFEVEGRTGGEWVKLFNGTAIGHKLILRLSDARAFDAFRLSVRSAAGRPEMRDFSAYLANLPIQIGEISTEPEKYLKIFEWDDSVFYGKGLDAEHIFDLDLTDRLQSEDDVGSYELIIRNASGDARVVEAKAVVGGVEIPDYARVTDAQRATVYVPGVGSAYHVRLRMVFGVRDTLGAVLLRKL